MFDPNPFGVSFSQLSNKPIGHLIIKGGEANRASKIINTTGGFNSMVTSKGYLQLYNLTFNDELSVNDVSVNHFLTYNMKMVCSIILILILALFIFGHELFRFLYHLGTSAEKRNSLM